MENLDNQTKEYISLIKDYIYSNYKFHFKKPAGGEIKHPYFSSGIDYSRQVWDWGCYLASLSMNSIDDPEMEIYQKGIIYNFLDAMDETGKMPILISSVPLPEEWDVMKRNAFKPALCQHIEVISEKYHDYDWINEFFDKIVLYFDYYHTYQYHKESGLYVFKDDFAIGTDNDPTVFYRPNKSTGAVLINCFMYKELISAAKISRMLNKLDYEAKYLEMAQKLKAAINDECFDNVDGYYYSADVTLREIDENDWLHSNHQRTWKTLPIKITTWTGLLPLWANIASQEQANKVVKRYLNPEGLFSNYGIRSLGKNEKMYQEFDGCNPSCWLGPIWINANYFTYIGLKNYGFDELAKDMAIKTINVLGKGLKEHGGFYEYYDSNTGEGIRGLGMHGWNFLVLEMIKDFE